MSTDTSIRPLWRKAMAAYQKPDHTRSVLEIVVSAAPLALCLGAGWTATAFGLWWLGLLISIPAAAFLVRLFMIQHDCGHRSFFSSPLANDWTGRAIGVLTLTPYDCWRQTHAIHHATSGNLDRRGLGELLTLTVEEYRALPWWRKAGYRLYRHPLVLFGIGPAYTFLLEQRWPVGLTRQGWRPWVSAMVTNVAVAGIVLLLLWLGGWQAVVFVYLPTLVLGASIGVWLFYIQHQFEGGYWTRNEGWDHTEAALKGSSYYDLPAPLRWLTANIGVHHVHHVSSKIPFYRLPKVLRDHPELKQVSRLGLLSSLRCVGLALWDEAGQRLIRFRDLRREAAPARA